MASTSLEILLKAKNETDPAFRAVAGSLKTTDDLAKKTSQSLDSMTVRAGKLSDAIGRTSTTLARSADAFGLSAGAMRAIGDVADVAQLGFENLNKSAVGFNASSLAVVGAGFAIGTALGNMAMQFDIVRENAYAAGEAIHNAFSSQQTQSIQESAAATANWAIEAKKAAAGYEALLRQQTAGKSAKEIQALLFPEPPKGIRQQILDDAKAFEEAEKKKAEAAKRSAAEQASAAKLAAAEQRRAVEEENRLREHTAQQWDAFFKTLQKEESDLTDWVEAEAKARTDAIVKGLAEEMIAAREADEARRESYLDMSAAISEGIRRRQEDELAAAAAFAGQLHDLVGILDDFGISADSAFSQVISGFANGLEAAVQFQKATTAAGKAMAALGAAQSAFNSGSAAGGAMTGAAFGAQFGILGAGIGAVGGAILGFFGKAKKAREEMEKLRSEFVKSAGGMPALSAAAKAAGISLDGMFKQKSAKALEHQIDTIKRKLQDWDDAQKILKEGMEAYGIAVSDMGGRFAALELDEQAKKMALFFAGATQIGANMTAVTAGMKDEVLALVAQYQAAGIAIPAALRPVLEAMLKNGQLTKENGEAYGSLEEAGFSFAETMEGVLGNLADELAKLRQVLAQGFHIPVTYDINGAPGAPSGGGGGPHNAPREDVPEFANAFVPHRPGGTLGKVGERTDEYAIEGPRLQQLIAGAIAMAGAQYGGSAGAITVNAQLNLAGRELGQANANISRRRQGYQSPNNFRRT